LSFFKGLVVAIPLALLLWFFGWEILKMLVSIWNWISDHNSIYVIK
jgi:hypothetical protein